MIRILESKQVGRLLARKAARFTEAEAVVRPILEAVRQRGDRALLEYARQFDRLERKSVRVPEPELRAAREALTPEFRAAVETAAANIRAYAERQMPREWTRPDQARPAARTDRAPARYRGRLHSRRPLSAALHADDDRDSGAGGGRAQHLRRLSAARWARSSARPTCWACTTYFRWAARRPSRPSPSAPAPCRAPTASSAPATSTSPPPRNCWPAKSASISSPVPPKS